MNTRNRERLHELQKLTHKIQRSLRSPEYDIVELEPGITQAREGADRLEKWLDELIFIAETELMPQPGRPRANR